MCAVHPAWEAATNALRDSLAGVSLRDVVDIDAGLSAGTLRASPMSHRKKRERRKRR
jgi:DNA-binding IscR family transcriptional regulator